MKINKGFASVLIILAIVFIAGVSAGSYYLGKKSNKTEVVEVKEQTQKTESNQNSISTGLREFKNDDIGISFLYPKNYGDVNIDISYMGTNEPKGPFNVFKQYKYPNNKDGYDFYNLRSFSANFLLNEDIKFGGGFECWGCEGGEYMGDSSFLIGQENNYKDFEKFYTNNGDMGLLIRGTMKPGEICEGLDCNAGDKFYHQGYFSITFKVNTDYRGITFYIKDTPENIALLKGIIIKK